MPFNALLNSTLVSDQMRDCKSAQVWIPVVGRQFCDGIYKYAFQFICVFSYRYLYFTSRAGTNTIKTV